MDIRRSGIIKGLCIRRSLNFGNLFSHWVVWMSPTEINEVERIDWIILQKVLLAFVSHCCSTSIWLWSQERNDQIDFKALILSNWRAGVFIYMTTRYVTRKSLSWWNGYMTQVERTYQTDIFSRWEHVRYCYVEIIQSELRTRRLSSSKDECIVMFDLA
jgi:hypothetical protein